jgi:hypothetical protein
MAKDIFPLPFEIPDMHYGHESHLCVASAVGFVKNNTEEYKKYVRNPEFVCKNCGRAANSADYLCEPEKLLP